MAWHKENFKEIISLPPLFANSLSFLSLGACSSLATALVWLCGFFVTKSFDTVANALGIYWCFWIFGICCFMGFVSIYFTVPETNGKSLEQIQRTFQKS